MKSLRTELILTIGALVLVVSLLLGGAATYVAGEAMRQTAVNELQSKSADAARIIGTIVKYELDVLRQVAQTARVSNPASSRDEKVAAMKEAVERNGYVRVFLIAPMARPPIMTVRRRIWAAGNTSSSP
jgi:hypothetical protein